jgi:hypothetical protein
LTIIVNLMNLSSVCAGKVADRVVMAALIKIYKICVMCCLVIKLSRESLREGASEHWAPFQDDINSLNPFAAKTDLNLLLYNFCRINLNGIMLIPAEARKRAAYQFALAFLCDS